jgi:hypothetical protein
VSRLGRGVSSARRNRGGPLQEYFRRVTATPEEVAEYRAKNSGHYPGVYRNACNGCGQRIWGSGFAVASHFKACPHPYTTRAQAAARQGER